MKIHDISIPLDVDMVLYPGDPGVIISQEQTIKTHGWNLTKFTMGCHNGTHLDTKLHISDEGPGIESVSLSHCMGKCKVIDLTDIEFGEAITRDHLKNKEIQEEDIILFKTRNSSILTKEWRTDNIIIDLNAAKLLSETKVKAVGIDYLTIGPKDTHEQILNNNILAFEGLNLESIEPGEYYFIALPLKMNTEGSPVRAILIEDFNLEERKK